MKTLKTVVPMLFVLLAAAQAAGAAGGLLPKLPPEGAWVKYNMEMKADQPQKKDVSGTVTVKSLGSVKENGEVYRWIEIEMEGMENDKKVHSIMKALIREKDLKSDGKNGLTIQRGWQVNTNGDMKLGPREFNDNERASKGPVGMLLHTSLTGIKTVKKARTIDFQKGQLKIDSAQKGDTELELGPDAPAGLKYAISQTVWADKSIPTGLAALEIEMTLRRNDNAIMKMNMNFTVQDYGKGAKSALPDKN